MSRKIQVYSLPVTRRQLFAMTYKGQFTLLIRLSLLISLFALPLFFVEGLRGVHSSLFQQRLESGGVDAVRAYLAEDNFFSLFCIPAFLILSVGLCGGYTLMKQYTFAEGFVFPGTFWQGIRKNAGEFLRLTLLFSVVFYLIRFARNFFVIRNLDIQIPAIIMEAVLQLLLLCAYLFGACQIPVYRNRLWRTAKNALLMTFIKLPKTAGVLLISYLPLRIVWYFQSTAASAAVLIAYTLLGWGHSILLTTLFCQSCFDELVNRSRYPQLYRRGLYDPQSGEDDL